MTTDSPKAIRQDMARTREDIDHTVTLLKEKIQGDGVTSLARAGFSQARHATESEAERQLRRVSKSIDSAGSAAGAFVKRNPLATALIGLGLGLLLARRDNASPRPTTTRKEKEFHDIAR